MASKSGPPSGAPPKNYAPNQTLYLTNLPTSKITKQDLRALLYILFSTYGPVLDVVALRTPKMRGQAHIVFRDIQTATQAMRQLEGFEFYGKPLNIQYAKTKSDTIAKLDGTFRMPSAKAADVTATELQQSVFGQPPRSIEASTTVPSAPGTTQQREMGGLKPPPGIPAQDVQMEDVRSPAASGAGTKRRREEEEEEAEDSDSDVAMEEDSDDE